MTNCLFHSWRSNKFGDRGIGIVRWFCAILNPGTSREQGGNPFLPGNYRFHRERHYASSCCRLPPIVEAQNRVAELIEGTLPSEEKSELDHFMDSEHILRVANARARQILAIGS